MYKSIRNIGITSRIARLIQTIGDYFAYFYFQILTFPFLAYFLNSENYILLYQRNIEETIFIYRSKLFLHFERIKIPGITVCGR